jgi:hypothetical protein
MPSVELNDQEWQQIITALAMQHPLVVKIAGQLHGQQPGAPIKQADLAMTTERAWAADGKGGRP